MNTLEKLKLFRTTLEGSELSSRDNLGRFSNDIESIYSSLENVSDEIVCSFSKLWAALEIVAVNHQENDTQPTRSEKDDLLQMIRNLGKILDSEIERNLI